MTAGFSYNEQTRLHTYNGLPIPSVSQIIAANDFTEALEIIPDEIWERIPEELRPKIKPWQIPKDMLDRAVAFGNKGHKMIEYDLANNLDVAKLPEVLKPYYAQYQKFRSMYLIEQPVIERRLLSKKYRYCGRPDIIALVNGKWTILDFKFTARCMEYQVLQTAGYQILIEEEGLEGMKVKIEKRMVVRFDMKKELPEVKPHDDKTDNAYFLSALSMYNFKAKKGLLKEGKAA